MGALDSNFIVSGEIYGSQTLRYSEIRWYALSHLAETARANEVIIFSTIGKYFKNFAVDVV